ncbi:TPA: lysis protein [Salmonella enterica]|nr:lysis protein [Salmonella enterica]ECF1923122.1 lysis protein [Salmonella enterica subsp. enterica serovar Newport]ECM3182765.1 lysis protein [Salmonella enterica subsp. enterica serovar Newport]MDJ3783451.1 class II holin family protein [Salmonella enterica]HAF1608638.1 lysis protein [Salmonella enterica]
MRLHTVVSNTSYSTAFSTALYAFLDHFSHDEWYAIGVAAGAISCLVTMVANIYFQRQRNRIMEQQKNGAKDES